MDPAALQVLHHVLEARRSGSAETVSLPGADLRGAQLLRADLVGADLSGAGLDHAQLAGAKLGHANLQTALLRGADLNGADLTGADLRGADLTGARLEGASLADADLRSATVEGAVGEPATVAGATIDQAMCDRSRLLDSDIIQLWRAGAIIDDLDDFDSLVITDACSLASEDIASDAGPPTRQVANVEVEARRHRLQQDDEVPPSARVSQEVTRIVLPLDDEAPLSMRSLKLVADNLTPAMIAAPEFVAGDEVMGATLEEVIGEGNAAKVWRGTTAAGTAVAVKLFRPNRSGIGLSLPAYRRGVAVMNRLTGNETEGVARLRCVSLNKLGFVMDLAANGSAVDLPALGWKVKSAVAFFEKLCRTVEAAHADGALHRCLKPSNVLLDGDLNPLLADFDMIDLPTVASEARSAGGYGPYAAPEELMASGTQSPTADIFSLGRILYFLLHGADPEEPLADIPALKPLKNQPAGLTRIIRKCTMRVPEARYQWVSELLADVDHYEDYDQVGLEGGPEANYLPYRLSTLSHKTPWLGRKDDGARADRERELRRAKRRKRGKLPEPPPDPLGLSRKSEKTIGALGASAVLVAMLVIMLRGGDDDMLFYMQLLSAVGGAGMSLLLPRVSSQGALWRIVWIVVALVGLFFANLPGLMR